MAEKVFKYSNEEYIDMASRLAEDSVRDGGGPFGAIIVGGDGRIVSTGVNTVTKSNDPTAHAEVNAIRSACRELGTFKLEGCIVYSSCEPCPMCLSALYWAGVKRIYYGNTKEDAAAINFSDEFIYRQLARLPADRSIPCEHVESARSIKAFEIWASKPDKTEY